MWSDFTSWLDVVFGGWPNFTQGALGAFVGVLGAYGVAAWVARREVVAERERAKGEAQRERERFDRELARDRASQREIAGRASAGDLIRSLLDLEVHVERVGRLHWVSGSGIATSEYESWERRTASIRRDVALSGSLVSRELEADLTRLIAMLTDVMTVDTTEDGMLLYVDSGNSTHLATVRETIGELVEKLQSFRREGLGLADDGSATVSPSSSRMRHA